MERMDAGTLFAGAIALVVLIDISALWVMGKPVPQLLEYLATSVFGFYFGRDRGPSQRGGDGAAGNGGDQGRREVSRSFGPVAGPGTLVRGTQVAPARQVAAERN